MQRRPIPVELSKVGPCNLVLPLLRQAQANSSQIALDVGGTTLTYAQLSETAGKIAGWIGRETEPATRRIAVLASRTWDAYAGVLGVAWAGAAYVPINPSWPAARIAQLLAIAQPDGVIADPAGLALIESGVLPDCPAAVLAPSRQMVSGLVPPPAKIADRQIAYIIFTSGSTGVPKGVMVSNSSVNAFLHGMHDRYGITGEDRLSQASELTFDVSVFDMFMAWNAGASLHVVPKSQLMAPRDFIREKAITVWFSVPSIAIFMQRMKMLAPASLPKLRYSLFAGEPLPAATASAWQLAAPNSSVENLYGPTEATVVCLGCRFRGEADITPDRGTVSTGTELAGVGAAILDEELRTVFPGAHGQLAISGPQLAEGYLGDPGLTRSRFPDIDGRRWYLTGDLAYQDQSGVFHHLGRIDNQVKVHGHRVELEEIESHLRTHARTDSVVAIPWQVSYGSAEGIVAFVSDSAVPLLELQRALKSSLPSYMVPAEIRSLDKLPLGPSGKFDRKALMELMEPSK
jgi:D-alanine--poly(phosphoribitol) ligase subunit 1